MTELRWITLLTGKPAEVCEQAVAHLGLSRCFAEDEVMGFGLSSAVFPLGVDQFLEISAPVRDDASPARHLHRAGPGVYMLVVEVDDLDPHRQRLEDEGLVRVVGEFDEQFPRGRWQSLHLHPRDVGGAIVSLDSSDPPDDFAGMPAPWREHVRPGVADAMVAVELGGPDPVALAGRWSAALGVPARGSMLTLDGAELRFTRNDGPDRVLAVELHATDRDRAGTEFTLAGTPFRLV